MGEEHQVVEHPWQVSVSSEILCHRDTMAITATGSGKIFSYILPLIVNPSAIVLVVSPLLALMEDQVNWARHLGFTVIQIRDKTIKDEENLAAHVCAAEFQLVIVQPEICQLKNKL